MEYGSGHHFDDLPVIAMAFALQKFIIKGVLMGAVKGKE